MIYTSNASTEAYLKNRVAIVDHTSIEQARIAANEAGDAMLRDGLKCGVNVLMCGGGAGLSMSNPLLWFFTAGACFNSALDCIEFSDKYVRWKTLQKAHIEASNATSSSAVGNPTKDFGGNPTDMSKAVLRSDEPLPEYTITTRESWD
ncbi:MAG: hypothetical protein EOP45_16865 [Sphingobacteriaceae bacterium]|nr:MAG: hypothetical protein EOP45_16865 [Sphingobacteriaceae bacterium]